MYCEECGLSEDECTCFCECGFPSIQCVCDFTEEDYTKFGGKVKKKIENGQEDGMVNVTKDGRLGNSIETFMKSDDEMRYGSSIKNMVAVGWQPYIINEKGEKELVEWIVDEGGDK